jgi:hypothetical protein
MKRIVAVNILCCSSRPVASIGDSKNCIIINVRWNQHSFVSWQDGLAEGNRLGGFVLARHSPNTIITVRSVWEGLVNLSVFVTVKSAILQRAISDIHE